MHKVHIFFNSAASSSMQTNWRAMIEKTLFRSQLCFVCPSSVEEMNWELEKIAREQVDVVISIGGDGTFNSILQYLVSMNATFLVVPGGAANDLASELGIGADLVDALEQVRMRESRVIDLISINGRYMATNGGIGAISDVALAVNGLRKSVPGFKSLMSVLRHRIYPIMLARTFIGRTIPLYRLRIDCENFVGEVETPLFLVNNQSVLAKSFCVAPETNNSDGKFNITIFTHKKRSDFLSAVYRLKQGLPMDHDPDLISFETRQATIDLISGSSGTLSFCGDGELLARSPRLIVEIVPAALKVIRLSNSPKLRPGLMHRVTRGDDQKEISILERAA